MNALFSLQNIRQAYNGRTVLNLEHLEISQGSILGLSGPNGCGKSTLLRLLAFLESPAEGTVLFKGYQYGLSPNEVHRRVTLLVQEPYLLKRSVFANVGYGLKVRGEKDIEQRVHEALDMVGLDPDMFAKRSWYELSGGEAQRVALASRLVLRPTALLMDEPTASLDESSAGLVRKAAETARQQYGTTLVIVSHDLNWLRNVCDSILFMERGRIVEQQDFLQE
ncbi:ATP-binding cassette domain-containing protein [Salidesulfovibrio onnuriiensis]|uniref:ATP-binding cassette domain-containing protein n=1 Tax=Salidesulfovibrio onnuriiensis TaxID=2583823 RepID=UPI0011CAE890|nr:ATP-binding cassette domain-containing protein [Salidesulfovibrio onnuriiensis]